MAQRYYYDDCSSCSSSSSDDDDMDREEIAGESFDVQKYTGKWLEVARLQKYIFAFEKPGTHQAGAEYTLPEKMKKTRRKPMGKRLKEFATSLFHHDTSSEDDDDEYEMDGPDLLVYNHSLTKKNEYKYIHGKAYLDRSYQPKRMTDPVAKLRVEFPFQESIRFGRGPMIKRPNYFIRHIGKDSQGNYMWAVVTGSRSSYAWVLCREGYQMSDDEIEKSKTILERVGVCLERMVYVKQKKGTVRKQN